MKRTLTNFKNIHNRECLKFLMRERVQRVVAHVLYLIIIIKTINY
jgi:hypothetical protein